MSAVRRVRKMLTLTPEACTALTELSDLVNRSESNFVETMILWAARRLELGLPILDNPDLPYLQKDVGTTPDQNTETEDDSRSQRTIDVSAPKGHGRSKAA